METSEKQKNTYTRVYFMDDVMETQLIQLYCLCDDFMKDLTPRLQKYSIKGKQKRPWVTRTTRLAPQETMTIFLSFFLIKANKDFKNYYEKFAIPYLKKYFPNLVSYNRFVELIQTILVPLSMFLDSLKGKCTGISFVDSTSIAVCHNKRARQNKVFHKLAKTSKTSKGYFYGFKLHLVINHLGEFLSLKLTPATHDDRKPLIEMCKRVFGKLFGDKGYISWKKASQLAKNGVQLITRLKKTMKNKLMLFYDRLMLNKRTLIESAFNKLKNVFHLEHSRHRSPLNFLVHVLGALTAYCLDAKKPRIKNLFIPSPSSS